MAWILEYGTICSAGSTTEQFWKSLSAGQECFQSITKIQNRMPVSVQISPDLKVHICETEKLTALERLLETMSQSWSETRAKLSPEAIARIGSGQRLGVIFASTKGLIDDLVWQSVSDSEVLGSDPMTPVLTEFLKRSELKPARRLVVSNACASGLSAVSLALDWLRQGGVEDVIILGADTLGAFVIKGFESLKVFAQGQIQPFSESRTGFFLGEGAGCVLVSNIQEPTALKVHGAGVDAEGYAITRPSQSGQSLQRACRQIPDFASADLIVAHGTATLMNDVAEDAAYSELFPSGTPWITSTKWCIGHTLGASSVFDLIVACEILRRQEIFPIAPTVQVDTKFHGRYVTKARLSQVPERVNRILVSSLGFGGIHAALLLGRDL